MRASPEARRGLGEGRGCSGGSSGVGSKVRRSKAGHLVKNLNFRSDNQEIIFLVQGFPGDSDSKEFTYNVGDLGLIPGLGRSPGEVNGYLLSILAWRIPWTEEPGRLQSMRSQSRTRLSD